MSDKDAGELLRDLQDHFNMEKLIVMGLENVDGQPGLHVITSENVSVGDFLTFCLEAMMDALHEQNSQGSLH